MPDTAVLVRTSERRAFKTCRQMWWWSYVDHLKAIETAPALRFGDLVHRALADWYMPGKRRGKVKPADVFLKLYDAQLEEGQSEFGIRMDSDEKWMEARDLGPIMLEGYVARWGKDERYRVITSEMAAQVDVFDKYDRYMCTYVLQFDIVVEDLETGQLGLIETKTAKAIDTSHLPLDEQAGSYWAFAGEYLRGIRVLKAGQDIDFIMYNFLRKAKPDDRPRDADGHYLNKPSKDRLLQECTNRGIVTVKKSSTIDVLTQALVAEGVDVVSLGETSKSQPPPLFLRQRIYRDEEDRKNLMYRVRAETYEMGLVKAGKLPVYKNPSGSWPDQHCKGCEFRDMCALHESGGDWEELRDLTMRTWDPYEAHRDSIIEEDD